jgi:hypothetical protein
MVGVVAIEQEEGVTMPGLTDQATSQTECCSHTGRLKGGL